MGSEQSAGQKFPRVYRVNQRTRHTVNFLLVTLAGLFLFLTVLQLARFDYRRSSPSDLIFIDVTVAALVVWLGSAFHRRVILHQDAIEVAGWFCRRKLDFMEIRGRQTTANSSLPYGYAYVLVPSDISKRKLVLPPFLHTDQNFRDWIKTIPKVPR
jgi:hypothetical protein